MSWTLAEALRRYNALQDSLDQEIRITWRQVHQHRRNATAFGVRFPELQRLSYAEAKRSAVALRALLKVRKDARNALYGVTR